MLLLMRRVGEVVRINRHILIEIKHAKDDEVTFAIHGADEEQVKNTSGEDEDKMG
jgi:sRNA-binding carbon storage regulator CsrA